MHADLSGRTIAVTGATGFIGRNVVLNLLDQGAHVRAVVRSPHKATDLVQRGVEVRKADISDREALAAGFSGCDGVVACAALVSLGRKSAAEVIGTNVAGTTNQIEAAADAGAKRVVLMSSIEAYAPTKDHVYREDDPLVAPGKKATRFNAYGLSKSMAERGAWEVAEARGLELTSLRPGAVHGAFDVSTITVWLRRLLSLPIAPFPTHTQFTSVYVGDLAEAVALSLKTPASVGRAYNICGEAETTLWRLKDGWAEAGGRMPKLILPFPLPIRRIFEISRAKEELGWSNRPVADGFREMFAREAEAAALATQASG